MQPESSSQSRANGTEPDSTQCPNCQATLPRGLRFCRACGYRLGEGLEEYVETIRLKPRVSQPQGKAAATDSAPNPQTTPFQPGQWGPVVQAGATAQPGARVATTKFSKLSGACSRRKRGGWMVWMIIAIIIFSVSGGGLLAPFALRRIISIQSTTSAPRSYAGVDGFESAEGGGAMIGYVTPPGSPADKAGLVGGDVVTSFDGKPVKDEREMRKLLRATPVGKTVEVVFVRDGQTKTTQLTTTSEEGLENLRKAFKARPEGIGYLGEGTDIDVVPVPGMNINGVRLNEITKSRPADMSGLKDGDIVIEFDGVPTRTRRELEYRIQRAIPYSTVKVVVIRNGERKELDVKVGIDD